jgi:hypothetical protein
MDEMIAGARVDVAPLQAPPGRLRALEAVKADEPEWESPWGPGRPGLAHRVHGDDRTGLGLPIDIHGGGIDLVFPHHENELAQGVCAGHGAANTPRLDAQRLPEHGRREDVKSVGNVALAHDLLDQYPGEAIRWALLAGHYRQPLEWTGELIEGAKSALDGSTGCWTTAGRFLAATPAPDGAQSPEGAAEHQAVRDAARRRPQHAERVRGPVPPGRPHAGGDHGQRRPGRRHRPAACCSRAGRPDGFPRRRAAGLVSGRRRRRPEGPVEALHGRRARRRARQELARGRPHPRELDRVECRGDGWPQRATWRIKEQA